MDILVIWVESSAGEAIREALRDELTYKISLIDEGDQGVKLKVNEQMWSLPLSTGAE